MSVPIMKLNRETDRTTQQREEQRYRRSHHEANDALNGDGKKYRGQNEDGHYGDFQAGLKCPWLVITVKEYCEQPHTKRQREKQAPAVRTNYQSAEGKAHQADEGRDTDGEHAADQRSSGNELVKRPHVRPGSGFV